jgi:hypothetical protein
VHVLAALDEHEPNCEANRDPEPDSEPGASRGAAHTAPAGLSGNSSCQSCDIELGLRVSTTNRRLMYHYGGST